MNIRLLISVSLLLANVASGQNISGVIYDRDSLNMIPNVVVTNTRTNLSATSNTLGAYIISAGEGDTIVFTRQGYILQKEIVSPQNKERFQTVLMKRPSYRLSEVEIVSDERVKDSINQRIIYKKTIEDAERKPKLHVGSPTGFGLFLDGPFTALARRISGKQKKDKAFVEELTQDEQNKYIQTRYNIAKVTAVMNINDSLARAFIAHNPMPYDFARTARELEIKMWIRERFREWKH